MKEKRPTPPRHERSDSGDAVIADTARLPADAEEFAEEFIATATSAEDAYTPAHEELVVEELGGPYLEIDGRDQAEWFSLDADDEPPTVRDPLDVDEEEE